MKLVTLQSRLLSDVAAESLPVSRMAHRIECLIAKLRGKPIIPFEQKTAISQVFATGVSEVTTQEQYWIATDALWATGRALEFVKGGCDALLSTADYSVDEIAAFGTAMEFAEDELEFVKSMSKADLYLKLAERLRLAQKQERSVEGVG